MSDPFDRASRNHGATIEVTRARVLQYAPVQGPTWDDIRAEDRRRWAAERARVRAGAGKPSPFAPKENS